MVDPKTLTRSPGIARIDADLVGPERFGIERVAERHGERRPRNAVTAVVALATFDLESTERAPTEGRRVRGHEGTFGRWHVRADRDEDLGVGREGAFGDEGHGPIVECSLDGCDGRVPSASISAAVA